MLGVADYHRRVPREYVKNLRFRRSILDQCEGDTEAQAAMREACRQDILLYVNTFVYQFNPKKLGEPVGPFITWEFQDRGFRWMLECVEQQKDGVVEKSREQGWSWMVLILQDWLSIFHEWTKHFCMSRNFDAVDKPLDSDSLFWKIDFMHERLPDWLLGEVRRRKGVFEFQRTRSGITSQASTGEAGVGGRATTALIDELGKIKEDHEVVAYTADTSDCRFFVSTHTGVGTAFHRLTQRPEVRKFVSHWSEHPIKSKGLYKAGPRGEFEPLDKSYVYPPEFVPILDGSPTGGPFPGIRSPWYDSECVRRETDRAIKLNLDIDVAGATKQFYEPILIRSLKEGCRSPDWQGDLFFDTDAARPIELTPRADGPLKLWFIPGINQEGRIAHVPGDSFVIGADPSHGTGATPSCLSIFNATRGEKWGEYTNPFIKPERLGRLMVAMARLFRDADGEPAFLIWETPGPGIVVGQTIYHELGFHHVHFRTDVFNGEQRSSDMPGWNSTSAPARLYLHDEYQSALRNRKYVNYSESALEDTLALVHDKGSVDNPKAKKSEDPSGAGLNHSDHVVADALSWFGAKMRGLTGEPLQKKLDDTPHPNSIAGRQHFTRQKARQQLTWK